GRGPDERMGVRSGSDSRGGAGRAALRPHHGPDRSPGV
ncbi:MAG: hypothetical protein AVDCRST_MAG55-3270, partial [uncultured Rubrobacteraceae bacterium]